MENNETQPIAGKDIANTVAASYIIFAFTFLLVFNTVETDLSLFIGFIGLIIFLTQAKHIKPEIRTYIYVGIIIYIITLFISILYVAITVSTAANAIVSHAHGNEFSGKYFIKYFYDNYFIFTIILTVIYTISYIFISYKFILKNKLLFMAGLISAAALQLIYSIMDFINMKAIIGNEYISFKDIGSLESSIKYAADSGDPLILKIVASILFTGLFIYLGLYIRKHSDEFFE